MPSQAMRLSELSPGIEAIVASVEMQGDRDTIATRLRDLGFVAEEPVRVIARSPLGGDPLVVQIGFTRFALRRAEAARIIVTRD